MTCTLCPPGYQYIEDLAEHDRIWHDNPSNERTN